MPPVYYFLLASAFVLGACIGSFLNVCIHRIPAGESIVSPGSRCPGCGRPIRWYENIPLLSWLLLRGCCAGCGMRIAVRYPLVEALTGGLFLLVLKSFGFSWGTPVYWFFAAALVVITFIDLDHQIIPDVISLPGIVAGFAASFLLPWLSWVDSLLGVLAGGGSLLLVAGVYRLLTGKEGMGGGDVKLLAMIGAFLGWQAVLPVILFSSFAGSAVGIPLMLAQKADGKLALPFGPFLSLGALIQLFWGEKIFHWYLSLF
ncbi:type 4 prepilin peptidase 1 [Geothermobacter ehrlichii]|uniref:Prepilin leader peptidase/N-methyltransferase n=1 Tax=Geothermobacter ehrlichii TaxID=213224 RepID=A0A5D3WN67_9BACT|nr:A24 family peptidase [Geothermobacter ehrlichii]TYO99954.1 type 4 prepilin peptidase 1 [Geothermobacter ehrlichii]